MFNLAIDSKLPAYDLTRLRVKDVCVGNQVDTRGDGDATKKRIVLYRFEISKQARASVQCGIRARRLKLGDHLFRVVCISFPHCRRDIVHRWAIPKLESTVRYLGIKWTTPSNWQSKLKCSGDTRPTRGRLAAS